MSEEGLYETVRIDVATNLGVLDITPQDLQDETIRPIILEKIEKKTYRDKNHPGS